MPTLFDVVEEPFDQGCERRKGIAVSRNYGSAASGRFVGAELVIDPIGTVFEPLEHSPAPFRSHLISGECIGGVKWTLLDVLF
jgi:hypothetical protein